MNRTEPQTQPQPERRNRVLPVAGEARHAGSTAFTRAGFSDPTLVLRWTEIAGPEVARLAQPVKLAGGPAGGVLTVRALPAAALFLAHEKRALCDRINAFLGRPAISQIKFIQGNLRPAPPKPPPQKKAGPLPPADPSRCYAGPENLTQALQALARRRTPVG